MTKAQLLQNLNFGPVDSESEDNLDKIFIQTQNFNEFLTPTTALLLGSKGAGKSALYRLFTKYEHAAREMAGSAIENTYITFGTGFKDLPQMGDMQLLNQIEKNVISPESAWAIYITYKVLFQLYEKERIICGRHCRKVLQKSKVLPDHRLAALIQRLYEKAVGEPPQIDQIDFQDVSIKLSKSNKVSVHDLLGEIDAYLKANGKDVWLLIDKIDELFPSKVDIRKECIEGLFLTYIDFVARYSNIKLKIFLRTDIWNTLSFVNKSHLTDKTTTIVWGENELQQLLIKRAVYNSDVNSYLCSTLNISPWQENIDGCFNLLFPLKVYSGAREAKTLPWMIDHCRDGLDGVYPREIIILANYATKEELRNGEAIDNEPDATKALVSGLSIRKIFSEVSKTKVNSYLSEFSSLSAHFDRFAGQTTAEFSQKQFSSLMTGLEPSGEEMIRQMHETGVIAYSSGQVLTTDCKIVVPRLFRSGLGIVAPGRP